MFRDWSSGGTAKQYSSHPVLNTREALNSAGCVPFKPQIDRDKTRERPGPSSKLLKDDSDFGFHCTSVGPML